MIPAERARMLRLLDDGLSKAEVARQLGRSRQTIYNNLKADPGKSPTPRPSKLDPFKPYLTERLSRFDIPATVLFAEIRKRGYSGGISILRDFVSQFKDRQVRQVVDRFETEPGRQAQIDWGSCGTILHLGRRRRLSLFVLVLGHSRMIWARFVTSEQAPQLMTLLESAFRDLGGVPRELLVDNMKQIIDTPRTQKKDAVVQASFQDFADHFGFDVVACPAYWPRAKGKVERAILYIKRSFLEGRSFTDLDDLNAQLVTWLAEVANIREHGTTKARPLDLLALDQASFHPVATTAYPASVREERTLDHDGRFSFRGVRYSADPRVLDGKRRGRVRITVQLGTDQRVRAHFDDQLVADHLLAPPGSRPQDDPRHAEIRRTLRDRPDHERPKGKTPQFEQEIEHVSEEIPEGPEVEIRDLSEYEEAA